MFSALALAWVFKFLWAPLVDRYGSRRRGHFRSWILPLQLAAVVAAVCAALLGGFGCGLGSGDADAEISEAVTVEITELTSGTLRDVALFSGQLSAEQSVMVKAEQDGVIAEVLFADGQEVEEGTTLFRSTVGVAAKEGNSELAFRIAAGDPEMSEFVRRMKSRTRLVQMPPVGSELVDDEGVALITAWIESLQP